MKPTDVLEQEHRVIEMVLSCLEKVAKDAKVKRRLDEKSAADAIEFFKGFADRCHHGKEEDLLFPLLEEKGFPKEAGPTAVMRQEHVTGRNFVKAMSGVLSAAGSGTEKAVDIFCNQAFGYIDMLREHIKKEDTCLFNMANGILSDDDNAKLMERFGRAEREVMGHGEHERFLKLALDLADRHGVKGVPITDDLVKGCCGH